MEAGNGGNVCPIVNRPRDVELMIEAWNEATPKARGEREMTLAANCP
jgi:hypothetical protein